MRPTRLFLLLAVLTVAGGCVTMAGNRLTDLEPSPAATVPSLEHTIGGYSFHLDGGKMITSIKAGRIINDEIFKRWKEWGYISGHRYVKDGSFTGSADYEITLGGIQDGESSVLLQLISGFSLMVIPYYVDTRYTIVFDVRDRRTGQTWQARVEDNYNVVVSLLLLPALPVAFGGETKTHDRIAAHLYAQLKEQGAFAAAP